MTAQAPAREAVGRRIGALSAAALVAAAGAVVALGWGAARLGSAAITAGAAAGDVASPDARGPDLAMAQARIDGRSLLFIPSAPPPPPPPRVAEADRPPPAPPPPPPPPSRYGGPQVVALINDTVWFAGGEKVAAGESGAGVRVIAVNAPWSARVEWSGVEFDVDLFARDQVVYPDGVTWRRPGEAPAESQGAERVDAQAESVGDEPPGQSGQSGQSERAARRGDDAETEGTIR
jgi:hypothetical protein